ncbi:MAG: DUF2752 domain-containing protein [Prevotellaceae bacterium]|jgi:hypothetical protein|nr:DUF2752 domain-containing protein [Prevotellaceae bacterium]
MTKTKLYSFVFVACLAGYVWVIANVFNHTNLHIGCLFYKITHLPCPSCGSTRSVLALLNGDFTHAFYLNPLGFVIAVLLVVIPLLILFDIITKGETFICLYKSVESLMRKKHVAIPAIVLVLSNWIWNFFKYL